MCKLLFPRQEQILHRIVTGDEKTDSLWRSQKKEDHKYDDPRKGRSPKCCFVDTKFDTLMQWEKFLFTLRPTVTPNLGTCFLHFHIHVVSLLMQPDYSELFINDKNLFTFFYLQFWRIRVFPILKKKLFSRTRLFSPSAMVVCVCLNRRESHGNFLLTNATEAFLAETNQHV